MEEGLARDMMNHFRNDGDLFGYSEGEPQPQLARDDTETAVLYVVEQTEGAGFEGDTPTYRWIPVPGLAFVDEDMARVVCDELYGRLPKPTLAGYRVREYGRREQA